MPGDDYDDDFVPDDLVALSADEGEGPSTESLEPPQPESPGKKRKRKEKFKEKYFHKHCNRARKGQTHEKRPQPGQGAERMREVGLLMAGKRGPGQFVLSV